MKHISPHTELLFLSVVPTIAFTKSKFLTYYYLFKSKQEKNHFSKIHSYHTYTLAIATQLS